MVEPSIVALIPSRAASKRIPGKNWRHLGGRPLIEWTIEAAKDSGIFRRMCISTDSDLIRVQQRDSGCWLIDRPAEFAGDHSPDIEWIKHALEWLAERDERYDAFALLRPTSPFRTAETIKRAWHHFLGNQPCDSLRAVEPAKQHPGKMWMKRGARILPLLPFETELAPWHSSPTQILPQIYIQNASLEIAWTKTVIEQGTIAGTNILPFLTEGAEGFDINQKSDFERAEELIKKGVLCR